MHACCCMVYACFWTHAGPAEAVLADAVCVSRSPVRKMFRFQSGDAASPTAGAPLESPYAVSPIGRDSHMGSPLASPKRAQRKISRSPFKVQPNGLSVSARPFLSMADTRLKPLHSGVRCSCKNFCALANCSI